MNKITLKTFGRRNRTRKIGNSLYRICRRGNGKWYIHEVYKNGKERATANDSNVAGLKEALDKINSFTSEQELTSLPFR